MAIATTFQFPKHLDRDIDKIWVNTYGRYPRQFESIAKIENFPAGAKLVEAEVSGLEQVREISEGQGIDFVNAVEGHEKSVTPRKFGLGFQITEEMIEDAVHKNIEKLPAALAISMVHVQEILFWDLFNSGDDVHKSWDGAYIFADSHALLNSTGTLDNKTTAALSETSLQAAFDYFDTLVDETGYPVISSLKHLLVPTKLRWTAMRLAKQRGGVTATADESPNLSGNDMTTNAENGYVSTWSPSVIRYLDAAYGGDDDDWYALSGDHDMRFLWKRKARMERGNDFHTGSALYKVTARFAAACFQYKGAYKAVVG